MCNINDPIHGNIILTKKERMIIDHHYFQRLHRIKALGFLYKVFPSATHTRFEHSIGACFLSGKLIESIIRNTNEINRKEWLENSTIKPISNDPIIDSKYIEMSKIAALLHDVGHGPFSHASEKIMPSKQNLVNNNQNAKTFILEALKKNKKTGELIDNFDQQDIQADHEDFSLLLLDTILTDIQKKDQTITDEFIQTVAAIKDCRVSPPKNENYQIIKLVNQLIDGELDSDRLDYLMRDSYFCGVPYGKYDLDRLLDGLCLLQNKKTGELLIGLKRNSLSALEHYLFARFQMHVQIYTHRIDGSCNESFVKLTKNSKYILPSKISDYMKYDDSNILHIEEFKDISPIFQDRKLWKLLYESYNADTSNDEVIINMVKKLVGDENCAIYATARPIKKEKLLNFPIVQKNMLGEYLVTQVKSLSHLIAHYNDTYTVLRLFIKPDKYEQAKKIMRSQLKPINIENEQQEAASVISKIDLHETKQGGNY